MIGRLRGILLEKRAPFLLLDVQGVGYELEAPLSTFYVLPAMGAEVILYTHLVVRDDAHLLYAFASEKERGLFRSLIRVNGVGAKLGLGILSGIEAESFTRCVQEGDTVSLTRLPGVGKKTAERLIVEMRDRLLDMPESGVAGMRPDRVDGSAPGTVAEAVSALVALGYKPNEASRAVRRLDTEALTTEEIIRQALQRML
ncbi:Holliday junction DNA helicase subunit RuvA [Nitrosococcus oceani ATCC 19707]|uniref:Holliday junction branch migration complex subunit RuvA n=2 Tax=Nitrosococcus oceani TaxID=1229 RepID=RUVA_NITOC|nr:Holliday junction branch migration protein RuvA [Nitrosococcus oceani]Q3JES4.1 RecName: Full=Holliday junction branch migration complex subunit RuvA [Nitrosococcus oceani ATCC 19707]KFI20918.1 ATP-dependent DNA helicase RuvA [Nitrosococcus oceani C-27]ABA56672.1 Holliday junction DNA helicase subunit RuvA [Nitrosococcus oceani ATCC 19707]EDZ65492.1 Holliday junction DNA helicase RuvA [Nitrosococcus oceani AFC27]GEM20758.1 Holliday junction branch migration protein RuvA [Nitrosococcus oceani